MTGGLAGSRGAVVAGRAAADHLRVIHARRRLPDIGRMTGLAQIAGRNVCRILASGSHAIVAAGTAIADTSVIKSGWSPSQRAVAAGTVV